MGLIDAKQTDLLVIGGGINGAGIARDAAGRGLAVVLCEKGDLAQATSSASTKLIHGGLRYLEHYEFRLVRDALREREVLLRQAPHIIWPLRFVLPHHDRLRPRWLIRLGLLMYDHLGGRQLLPASRGVDLREHPAGAYLKPEFVHGFEYSDCWVQDARLVVLNARDAARRGAQIATRCECTGLERSAHGWIATLRDAVSGRTQPLRARAVVNAAGPWVTRVLDLDRKSVPKHRIRLVKGSHVVVSRLFPHEFPYIFQNADGRVLFAIPYEQDFTLLGTTDVEVEGDPGEARADDSEIAYICNAVSAYLAKPVRPSDVIWSYSGVRPLLDDDAENASRITRDYVLDLDTDAAPILSVFGGKITTFRKLAEQAVGTLAGTLEVQAPAWTARAVLPGGDIPQLDFERFVTRSEQRYPWAPQTTVRDYARNYGTDLDTLLEGCVGVEDLGRNFGGGLYEAEVRFLQQHEWARTADDIVWRRTKKGLRMSERERAELEAWLDAERTTSPQAQV